MLNDKLNDNKLYNIAYKHLLYSIHFGFYPPGSHLPSVPELCKSFGVSRTTLHSALKMLQEGGYVSLSQGRSALVTCSADSDTCHANYITYCQATRDALGDLNVAISIIWPTIMLHGLMLCGEEDLEELSKIADSMSQQMEYPYLEFYYRILQPLGNPLLHNLYLNTSLFGHCASIRTGERAYQEEYLRYSRELNIQILSLRKAGRYEELKVLLHQIYQKRIDIVSRFHRALPASDHPVKAIAYHWNFHTERPSVGFDLAMKLLRVAYTSYRPMEYLPSVAALSKQYGIPVITVRRAIRILSDIGVVETVNGKGTRVLVGSGVTVPPSRLCAPNMKKALLPYLQSAQALLIISRDVAEAAFPALPDSAVRQAAARLRQILSLNDYSLTLGAVYQLIIEHTQSAALRDILGGFLYFQYLGYPLKDLEPNAFRYDPRATESLLKSLEERDARRFAGEVQRLTADVFRAGKEKLLSGGVAEAESIAMPLISLLS